MSVAEKLRVIRGKLVRREYPKHRRVFFTEYGDYPVPYVNDLPDGDVYVERYDGTKSQ